SALLHYSAEPRLLRCVAENGVVLHIQLLGEGLLRFRYSTDGLFVEDFSYAISESFQVSGEWQVAEYEEYISLTTSCAECRIAREDLRITLLDRAGNVLLADEKGFHWEEPGAGAAPIVMMSKEARKGERYFGLGDKSCDFDLRGKRLQNWVHDSFGFGPDSDPLYKAIPFYMGMYEGRSYGIFFDNSFKTWFDFAAEREEATSFWAHGGEMNYYFFCESHPLEIASTYACLTGLPELPPLWSLGYHQSRWSYYPESEVLGLAKKFREEQIPCDSIYLDIDYMDGYRVFTWNFEHFPEPARMMAELEAQGFRTVAMLDPGIKIDPEYALFREGLEKNVFLRRSDGEYAKGKVWPGNCLFPDFTRPDVRSWWAGLYRDFLRKYGVHGIWNDMNEPACFEVESKTLPDDVRFDCDGHPASHLKAHNIYGMQMARASLEGIRENVYPRRPFLLTRATYSGGQRYAATWTGDNVATWEHLQIANRQVQRLSISGFSLSGSDIGGFNERPDGELFVRWLETGIFHPFFRVHSMGYNLAGDAAVDEEAVLEHMRAGRPIDQEPWSFGELFTPLARKIINLRYQLLPAIYTAVYQYVTYGVPVLRPLAFEAPGDALGQRDVVLHTEVGEQPAGLRHHADAPGAQVGQRY
ncbi:MAG: DUF4968 domain-containing protein, partial [Bacteroidetes bacterium]